MYSREVSEYPFYHHTLMCWLAIVVTFLAPFTYMSSAKAKAGGGGLFSCGVDDDADENEKDDDEDTGEVEEYKGDQEAQQFFCELEIHSDTYLAILWVLCDCWGRPKGRVGGAGGGLRSGRVESH